MLQCRIWHYADLGHTKSGQLTTAGACCRRPLSAPTVRARLLACFQATHSNCSAALQHSTPVVWSVTRDPDESAAAAAAVRFISTPPTQPTDATGNHRWCFQRASSCPILFLLLHLHEIPLAPKQTPHHHRRPGWVMVWWTMHAPPVQGIHEPLKVHKS
jgi:hypothetical protein